MSITLDLSDNENNPISTAVTKSDGSSLPAWLGYNSGSLTISGTATNSDVGSFTVRIQYWDEFISNAKRSHNFNIEVKTNQEPYLSSALPAIPDITVPLPIVYSHALNSFFSDREGDQIIMSVAETPDASWLNFDTGTNKLSGNPPDNTQEGSFTLRITAANIFGSVTLSTYQDISFTVIRNDSPIL